MVAKLRSAYGSDRAELPYRYGLPEMVRSNLLKKSTEGSACSKKPEAAAGRAGKVSDEVQAPRGVATQPQLNHPKRYTCHCCGIPRRHR